MDIPNIETTKRKWFSRPENWASLFVLGCIGLALFMGWGVIVPFVLLAAVNTLHLLVVAIAIAAIGFVVFDSTFRNLLFYAWGLVTRFLAGLIVSTDPIGIQKNFRKQCQQKLQELEDSIGEIRGQRIATERSRAANKAEYDKSFSKATIAKEKNDQRTYALESKQVARVGHLLERLTASLSKYDFIINMLSRYREVCSDEILDVTRDINVRQQEQSLAHSFRKAINSMRGILRGLPGKEMYDESTTILEQRYTNTIGDMEQFLNVTKEIIANSDMDTEAATRLMDQKISAWREKNSGIALGKTNKSEMISAAESETMTLTENPSKVPVFRSDDGEDEYRKLFS